jgi:RimJ/RimL family protein N-acetyltransferase
MTACPTLETERLILRPLDESDLDAYVELLSEPEVRAALHLPATYSRADAWRSMAQWRGQWELRGSGQWALIECRSGAFVGRAGLHRPEVPDWPGLEVGWALRRAWWGKGYATEAGRRSLAYAFEVIGADEVFSVIRPENRRSQAVARRLGLRLVGEQVLSSFPGIEHGIWRLGRDRWPGLSAG